MMNDPIESNGTPAAQAEQPKAKRKPGKKAKPSKKHTATKKTAGKPKSERSNKKADVIALMKRAKGARLAEIMKETGWQAHTVRGFVSILERREDRLLRGPTAMGVG